MSILTAELSAMATTPEAGIVGGIIGHGLGELDDPAQVSTTERRRAAVLVTVVSDYPSLVDRMTPLEAHRLVARVRDTAVDVVRGYGGLVNQAIGDEIVSLFGVPTAHDDDDLRAVRAALELHARVRALHASDDPSAVRLNVQSGLHVGPVVARRLHEGPRRYDIVGAPATLATRLAGLADVDTVLVSPETQRLVGPYMHTAACAPVVIDSQAGPVTTFRVLGETGIATRLEASSRDGADALRRPAVRAVDPSGACRACRKRPRRRRRRGWRAGRRQEPTALRVERAPRLGDWPARAARQVQRVRRQHPVRRLRADPVRRARSPPAARGRGGRHRQASRARRVARARPAASSASAVGEQREPRPAQAPPGRTSPGGAARRARDDRRRPGPSRTARRHDRRLALGGHRIARGVPARRGARGLASAAADRHQPPDARDRRLAAAHHGASTWRGWISPTRSRSCGRCSASTAYQTRWRSACTIAREAIPSSSNRCARRCSSSKP